MNRAGMAINPATVEQSRAEPGEKSEIRLRLTNGLTFERFKADVLDVNQVTNHFVVREASSETPPDVIVFGPYGSEVPPRGPYLCVGYICENYRYDGPECDFVFTVSPQSFTGMRSARIQWHSLKPQLLVKPADIDIAALLAQKDRFCNFLYSHRVKYREDFFRRLSKYKRVDAPGVSMRNMGSIDEGAPQGQSRWITKRNWLSRYKFTLALENCIFPGYQTEKLYDAMQANSIPVYVGDPEVGNVFNTRSMVTEPGSGSGFWAAKLRDFAQIQWEENQGASRWTQKARLKRRIRLIAHDVRHLLLLRKFEDALIDEIVALDRDEDKYAAMLREPWLNGNRVDESTYSTGIWVGLFTEALSRRSRREG